MENQKSVDSPKDSIMLTLELKSNRNKIWENLALLMGSNLEPIGSKHI